MELLLDDLRADDFEDFFAPVLRELDFFAPDLEPDRDFDDFFVADFAICGVLSFPFKTGHGNRISRRGEETTKRPPSSNRAQMFLKFIH